ncbi:hypothetical protein BH09PAT2_BH09PAT2_07780 [soil metagenome]
MTILFSFLLLTMLYSCTIVVTHAYLPQPQKQQAEHVIELQTQHIIGTVLSKKDGLMTIQTDSDTKNFTIARNIAITRNRSDAEVETIRPNDKVDIILGSDGHVQSVTATGTRVIDWHTLIKPGILVGVFVISAVIVKLHNSNPHIYDIQS